MRMDRFPVPVAIATALLLLAVAPGARADDATSKVESCSKKLGVLRVAEPQQGWGWLGQYGLGSPSALLRTLVMQSNCFDVVERGAGMQDLQQERAMAQNGDLRQESNVGKGQMQAADFVMTPNVQMSGNTGGAAGGLGGLLGGRLGVIGGIAGGLKFKEASTSLLISDVRSSIQVAAAEGKATKTDFNLGGIGFGGGALAAGGGYTNTPEGKIVAASFLDNYNKIVLQIRDNPQLLKPSSAVGDANAAASTKAGMPVNSGQVFVPKIGNVKVYADASRDSKVVGTAQKSDEMVASGEVKNGFVRIDASNFSGWVQQSLVAPSK
jgi:curli biogenesis system outer membrane secretion channel CsgG